MSDETTKTEEETKPKAAPKSKKPTAYYIVNPTGTIHVVTPKLAAERLQQVGYRKPTKAEIAKYKKAKGKQRAGNPLAKPYTTDAAVALEGAEVD